jgi:hypothetical protein
MSAISTNESPELLYLPTKRNYYGTKTSEDESIIWKELYGI